MRKLTALFSTLASTALLAASAHADDAPSANVFNADMSSPDLAAVITSFQDVCLPFITHTTELPQSLNQEHRVKLLADQGFQFQSRETQTARVLFMPAQESWKPASQQNRVWAGQFTVFTSAPFQEFESRETVLSQSGVVAGPLVEPAKYKTITRDTDSYSPSKDNRQTVLLEWNYASQNHPAKSCGVRLDNASISSKTFEADFISKDPDWRTVTERDETWSQCTIDGADEFWFTATRHDGQLSLSVRRNDFFELKLCGT